MTVREKLEVAQAEAEAVAEGLNNDAGPAKGRRSPGKRARVGGRPRRRQSTLTPEELEGLMVYS